MVKEALVVPRENLFKEKYFEGFLPAHEHEFISVILKNFSYCPRGEELENNNNLQQIIPYVWIINQKTKKVFLYKRILSNNSQNKEYVEKRYLNKYSGGIGGHIEKDTEEKSDNPIQTTMLKEMKEEVFMKNYPVAEIIGYIKDDSDSIGKVHFGVIAIAKTLENVFSNDKEGLSSGKFYSVEEVEELFANTNNEIENWTKISWPFVKKYLIWDAAIGN
ncbi:MAG: hypothetical protein AABW65_02395 [Nanoarchaeota archaeon]|mgnify:CR=1 FL=1